MSFRTLEIARSALTATRAALEIASQNVANANTPGYIRQRVIMAPVSSTDPRGGSLVGGGVAVQTVERLRDQCLEAQIGHQAGQLGEEQTRSSSLSRLQTYFPDLSNNGIASALGDVFNSLQRLQTMPGSVTAREEVIFTADTLCQQVQQASGKLQEERMLVDSDLELQVAHANQLLHQVGELNGKIMTLGSNPQANDLRVMREEAIRELSSICGAAGLDQASGSQDVTLGGLRLVQGSEVTELSLYTDSADPLARKVQVGAVKNVEGLSGKIAGDLTVRDGDLALWKHSLDELVATLADAFNTQHRAGVDLQNHAGGDFFTYDPAAPADSLRVTEVLRADPSLLAAAGRVDGPPGDGDNAANLADLREMKLFSGGTETALEFHGRLLYSIGAQTQRAMAATEARTGLLNSLEAQYTNQAGVSLDEEAVDVMQYQQTYTAALKLIQMADEMMRQIFELVK